MMLPPLRPVLNLPKLTVGCCNVTVLAHLAKSWNALIKQMFLITEAESDLPVVPSSPPRLP